MVRNLKTTTITITATTGNNQTELSVVKVVSKSIFLEWRSGSGCLVSSVTSTKDVLVPPLKGGCLCARLHKTCLMSTELGKGRMQPKITMLTFLLISWRVIQRYWWNKSYIHPIRGGGYEDSLIQLHLGVCWFKWHFCNLQKQEWSVWGREWCHHCNQSLFPKLQAGDHPEWGDKESFTMVFVQIPHDPEHFATHGAGKRLLSSVEPQVGFQIVPQTEAFAALGAGMRPLARVEPRVAPEALPQSKSLWANWARVWFFSSVKALMTSENLPPLERLAADVAHVSIAGVGDHLLESPDVVSTGGETAEAMAGVKTLVGSEVLRQRPTGFVFIIVTFINIILQLHLWIWHWEHVHKLYFAGKCQLLVRRSQFQLYVKIALFCRMHPFPNPNVSRSDGSIRRGRTVGGALGGADTGLLRLGLNGFLWTVGFGCWRLWFQDQRTNKVDLLPRSDLTGVWMDHKWLLIGWRFLRGFIF